jgi:hypothetical protein
MNSNSGSNFAGSATTAQLMPNELGDVGRLLYGEHWQTPLAAALGVSDRTIRYWLAGTIRPDLLHFRCLVALLERSRDDADDMIARLRERADQAAGNCDEECWAFGQDELQVVDDRQVLHVPTRTTVSFHRYEEAPASGWTPMGIVSNVGMLSGDSLRRFQTEAWRVMRRHRYGI